MSQGLIQGFMREAPLPDVIQLVSQGGKSGCFHVSEDARRAKIFLQNGRIVHAVSNDAEGLDAVYEVALWLDGQYRFEEASAEVPTTITKSNAALLMEMHRRMDEWRVISQKIPSLDLYPASTLLPGETPSGVSPREAKLLLCCTGFYSISELASVLDKSVLNVAKDIYGLVMANHVVMRGIRSGKRPDIPGAAPVVPVEAAPEHVSSPLPAPEPPRMVAPEPPRIPSPVPAVDPVKAAKLNAFAQRIVLASKAVLPADLHSMVSSLQAEAIQQIGQGEGPEAVKNLALSISRRAVESGLDAELVKNLNAQLKALFNK